MPGCDLIQLGFCSRSARSLLARTAVRNNFRDDAEVHGKQGVFGFRVATDSIGIVMPAQAGIQSQRQDISRREYPVARLIQALESRLCQVTGGIQN